MSDTGPFFSMLPSNAPGFTTITGYTVGSLSIADLELLHRALKKYKIKDIRLRSGSQLSVAGLPPELIEPFRRSIEPILQLQPVNGITSILNCSDCDRCGPDCINKQNLVAGLRNLDLPRPMPAKIKVAVAGCLRCCTMPRIRDIGFIPGSAHLNRWHISFGGNGGRKPRIGDLIATSLPQTEALEFVRRALVVYQREAERKMRTADYLSSTTPDSFIEKIRKMQSIDSGQGK